MFVECKGIIWEITHREIYLKLSQTVNLNFKRMNNNFKEE